VPSAGTIYPRLAKLEEDGLVTKSADGRKTVYAITDAGRAELAAREGELDGIENEVTDSVRRLANEVRNSVNSAMKTLRADLASAARDATNEARSSRVPEPDLKPVRVESRVQLQRADMALSEFRQQLRADLRTQVVAGILTATTVDLLELRLAEVHREITEEMQRGAEQEPGASFDATSTTTPD
jgi:DNA-binding MarR family transcriptional regulator